jgi:hypothetical protein
MGQFAQQFKDYEQYNDSDCYRRSVPANLSGALADLLITSCAADGEGKTVATMQNVANDLLSMAGKKATTNWDGGALRTEIKAAFHILQESTFDRFMDATLNAFQRLYKTYPAARENLLDALNDVLLGANMGYTVRAVGTDRLLWEARNEASAGVSSLVAAAEAVTDISKEALEHLEQAKAHLLTPTKSRSRKDAVRDAMSAMEAMVKKLASDGDFDKATKKLRHEKIWGNDQIVKDGHSTWGLLHYCHPDIRHGQPAQTDIDLEEALYWIDRITAYVKYMAARKRVLGR